MEKKVIPEICEKCGWLKQQCECDRPMTNADRIRSMSDEELAEFLCKVKSDYQWVDQEFPSEEECGEWEGWLKRKLRESYF